LSSPTAAHLIAQAYHEAGQKPPVLIACVRRPVDQALSWWKYENNAMKWGEGMMLKTWNYGLRGQLYPPKSVEDAVKYSHSYHVANMYQRAERFVLENVQNRRLIRLPQWAVTWPGGQLSALGRNSCFTSNISRYERAFGDSRRPQSHNPEQTLTHVTIFPMEYLRDERVLKNFLVSILHQVAKRLDDNSHFDAAIHATESSTNQFNSIHRNAGSASCRKEEVRHIRSIFEKDEEKLNLMLKVNGIAISYGEDENTNSIQAK